MKRMMKIYNHLKKNNPVLLRVLYEYARKYENELLKYNSAGVISASTEDVLMCFLIGFVESKVRQEIQDTLKWYERGE